MAGILYISDIRSHGGIITRINTGLLLRNPRSKRSIPVQLTPTVVWQPLEYPSSMSVDFDTNRLYWADSKRGVIESCGPRGEQRLIVYKFKDERPFKITVSGDFVFGTTYGTNKVFRLHKLAHVVNAVGISQYMRIRLAGDHSELVWLNHGYRSVPVLAVVNQIPEKFYADRVANVKKSCNCSSKLCLLEGGGSYICQEACNCQKNQYCQYSTSYECIDVSSIL